MLSFFNLYAQYAYQMKAENILNLNLTSEDMICYKNYAYDQFFDFSYMKNLGPVNFDGLLWLNDATFPQKNFISRSH